MNKASTREKSDLGQQIGPFRYMQGIRSSLASSQPSASQISQLVQELTQNPSGLHSELSAHSNFAQGEPTNLHSRLENLGSQQHSQMQSANPRFDEFSLHQQQHGGHQPLAGACNVQSAAFGTTGISHPPPRHPTENQMMQMQSHPSMQAQPNICHSTTQLQWSQPFSNQPNPFYQHGKRQ